MSDDGLTRAKLDAKVRRWMRRGAVVGLVVALGLALWAVGREEEKANTLADYAGLLIVTVPGSAALAGMWAIRGERLLEVLDVLGFGGMLRYLSALFGLIVASMVVAGYVSGW